MFKVRRGGGEEIPLVQGKEERLRFAGAAMKRYRGHPTPVLLPGKSHGQRSLVGCSPWGWEELDTTE